MKMSSSQIATMQALHSAVRFTLRSGDGIRADECYGCEVMDLATREFYATGFGASEGEALERALAAARVNPKPLTPAQRYDDSLVDAALQRDKVKQLEAQLAEAQAALAKASGQPAPSQRKGRRVMAKLGPSAEALE